MEFDWKEKPPKARSTLSSQWIYIGSTQQDKPKASREEVNQDRDLCQPVIYNAELIEVRTVIDAEASKSLPK